MKVVLLSVLVCCFLNSFSQTSLVSYGSLWKYLDNGIDQGTSWRSPVFDDAGWAQGWGVLGYGQTGIRTVLGYGSDANDKYITTYFRKTINVPDVSQFTSYTLNIRRDDGAVVYINGSEVLRTNMPGGTVTYTTLGFDAPDQGAVPQNFTLPSSVIQQGANTIAVEVHQRAGISSDLVFDMELIANNEGLTRGPYLNLATQTGITIRWRTGVPTDSKVSFGTTANGLTQSIADPTITTEHVVQLTNLSPNTRYYYSIGSTAKVLQGDAANYFKTLPPAGSKDKLRILAMGDMGYSSTNQLNVRDAYLNYLGTNATDVWMLLGDNAYESGLDAEYQNNFFNIYQNTLTKNHVLWPAPGNHDYANAGARQLDHAIPYYSIFSLPTNAEAGGVASGTKAFYSYNYGNVHFVALDSYGLESGNTRLYDTLGPQVLWLKQDLAANTLPWTIVYFHHPPYTKGSHDSDTETELALIRQNLVRIFERFKVDLVLCGHSHVYERSATINGHYDLESTFSSTANALSTSNGKYDGSENSCAYKKSSSGALNGVIYSVIGSSGRVGGTSSGFPHDAMTYSNATTGGCMVIEVEDNRLDAKWICSDSVVRDNFTVFKDVDRVVDTTITAATAVTLQASWIGTYKWSNGATTRSITVTPATKAAYTVTDNYSCLKDSFTVYTIAPVCQLTASVEAGTVACNGGTATFRVAATGGTGNQYRYRLDGGNTILASNPYTFTAVKPGVHSVTVTDANDCSVTVNNITVVEPPAMDATLQLTAKNANCFGEANGSIGLTATATGGTAPYVYQYEWRYNGSSAVYATTKDLANLSSGSYAVRVVVTDANNCSKQFEASTSVLQPTPVTANPQLSVSHVSCFGNTNGAISLQVNASGGAGSYAYSYAWRKNGSYYAGTQNLVNLSSGQYDGTITLTDANNCSKQFSVSATVIQPVLLTASCSSGTINCNGGTTAITVNANGGTPPYTYSLNGGAAQSGNSFSSVSAGNYTLTVRDAEGCTATTTNNITQPAAVLVSAVAVTDAMCKNSADGKIQVAGSGGTAPYLYNINGGAFAGTNLFLNLKAGKYSISIKDARGCVGNTLSITVSNKSNKCANAQVTASSRLAEEKTLLEQQGWLGADLAVTVSPNPSNDAFRLKVVGGTSQEISVTVFDAYGRVVFGTKAFVGQTIAFGSRFLPGLYIVKTRQADVFVTSKLIKVR